MLYITSNNIFLSFPALPISRTASFFFCRQSKRDMTRISSAHTGLPAELCADRHLIVPCKLPGRRGQRCHKAGEEQRTARRCRRPLVAIQSKASRKLRAMSTGQPLPEHSTVRALLCPPDQTAMTQNRPCIRGRPHAGTFRRARASTDRM